MDMYTSGECDDYRWAYDRAAPTMAELADTAEKLSASPSALPASDEVSFPQELLCCSLTALAFCRTLTALTFCCILIVLAFCSPCYRLLASG